VHGIQVKYSTTYSNCRAILANAALHENCVEVGVAGKRCTNNSQDQWQPIQL